MWLNFSIWRLPYVRGSNEMWTWSGCGVRVASQTIYKCRELSCTC